MVFLLPYKEMTYTNICDHTAMTMRVATLENHVLLCKEHSYIYHILSILKIKQKHLERE